MEQPDRTLSWLDEDIAPPAEPPLQLGRPFDPQPAPDPAFPPPHEAHPHDPPPPGGVAEPLGTGPRPADRWPSDAWPPDAWPPDDTPTDDTPTDDTRADGWRSDLDPPPAEPPGGAGADDVAVENWFTPVQRPTSEPPTGPSWKIDTTDGGWPATPSWSETDVRATPDLPAADAAEPGGHPVWHDGDAAGPSSRAEPPAGEASATGYEEPASRWTRLTPPTVRGRRPRRRRRRAMIAVTAVLIGLVLTASVGAAVVVWRDGGLGGIGLGGIGGGDRAAGAARTVAAPLDGRTRSAFQVAADITTVRLRGGDLGGDLYRVSVPAGSATVPEVVSREGQLVLRLVPADRPDDDPEGDNPGEVDIQLSSKVTWALRLTGGATTRTVDASALTVSSVLVSAGSTRTDLALARPAGQVPIRFTGGLDQLDVRVPAGAPVRVRARAGAGRVAVDGELRTGVAAGTAVATADWTGAPDRYDIDLAAGATAVTVTRAP